jgi:phage terminase large subunit-like protein
MAYSSDEAPPRTRQAYVPAKGLGRYYSPEEDMSLADKVAMLPQEQQEEILAGQNFEGLIYDNGFWCRPSQLEFINSTATLTAVLCGRGWGKSFALSKTIHKYAMDHPGSRLALVGRTSADVRDVMILGDSGIMNVIDPAERPEFKPMVRRLVWKNGSEAITFSAERPDAIRGSQQHASFLDEISSYRSNANSGLINAFDQIKLSTRLGSHPQIWVATTPKRNEVTLGLVKQAEENPDSVLLIRGSTYANRHLSVDYQATVAGLYEGTTLGKQELEGELLTDVDGALLTQSVIDDSRTVHFSLEHAPEFWKTLPFRAIGVDPSVSAHPNDECGIVAVGATGEKKLYARQGFVLEDGSLLGPPEMWASRVVKLARKYRAPVIAEANQGGEMVRMVIQGIDPRVPVLLVHAGVSKFERAEPVAAAYQRGRIHHCGDNMAFGMLESQWTGWAPGHGLASPDRLDATVHGLTALLVKSPKGWLGKVQMAADLSERHLAAVRDHDPLTGHHVSSRWGTSGKSKKEIKERLRVATDIPESDLEPYIDEDEDAHKQLRKAGRPSRMNLPSTMGSSSLRALDNRLYRPPTHFSR